MDTNDNQQTVWLTSGDSLLTANEASLQRSLLTADGNGVQFKAECLDELLRRARSCSVPEQQKAAEFFAKTIPSQTPVQHFREACYADRGYTFVRREGDDTIWQFRGHGKMYTARIKPNGEVEET